ncbi:unnamed protein product [Ostreobium quekettii]|uniref:Uncharacterized protein n=1 Tax=Ostreobium quekettii TaxID=121088 RepID=A0A8S1IT42_9CHLO|nr:unnamed protein product [Ostreobium quekettii]|eukprot:evm.model.scf_138.2 EVM.evm.TU.scf_138.2   scf_138:29783-31693(+)
MALLSFCSLQPYRDGKGAAMPPELDGSDYAAMIAPWKRDAQVLPGQLRRSSVQEGLEGRAPGGNGAQKDGDGAASSRGAASPARVKSLWQIVVSAFDRLAGSPDAAGTGSGAGVAGGKRTSALIVPEDGVRAPASSADSLTDAAASEEDRWRRSVEMATTDGRRPSPWRMSPECPAGWEELRWPEENDAERLAGVAVRDRRESRSPEELRSPNLAVMRTGCHRGQPDPSLAQLDRHLLRLEEEEGSEAGNSIGRHSAPAGCCGEWGLDGDAQGDCWDGATWDESVSEAGGEPQGRSLLDVLELRAELRRQEVLERVAYEEDVMAGIREEVRARKSEFQLLKTGMHTETPAVARLRRRWGSGQRARRRRRVQKRQNEEEELLDDIPLTFTPQRELWAVMPTISV